MGAVVERRAMTHAPAAEVEAGVQAQVAAVTGAAAIVVCGVVDKAAGNARIAMFDRHMATWRPLLHCLRHGQLQLQSAAVERCRGPVEGCGQVDTTRRALHRLQGQ